jgi:hypothetical protein
MPTSKNPPKPKAAKKSAPNASPLVIFQAGSDPLAVAPATVTNLAAELASFKAEPIAYDPKTAETLLDSYRPRLMAIGSDRLRVPRVQVDAVCRALFAIYSLTQYPPMLARYTAAAVQGEFDVANLDHLKALSLIQLSVYQKAEAAGAFATNAKIPATLDEESASVEIRMQKVAEHFFADDPVIGPLLQRLSPGTSYADRAEDLLGYANIYESKLDIVSKDPLHFRDTDIAEARRLAGNIMSALGIAMTPQAFGFYDLVRRTWTLLEPIYFEVRELGLRFLRYDPQREARFPSLYVVGRGSQGRRKTNKNNDIAAPEPISNSG